MEETRSDGHVRDTGLSGGRGAEAHLLVMRRSLRRRHGRAGDRGFGIGSSVYRARRRLDPALPGTFARAMWQRPIRAEGAAA